ncbi:ATP synthase A1 subunit C [Candidatus Woesearchaeota archaeon]|nr:ATP synthase A1 subunit C [Candidatus Woesearchaeota archaeon]
MARLKLEMEEPERIKLGFYPYTYVRTVVMRSVLFKRDDYIKMLKMSFNEIAKFLQESHYKDEINEFANQHSGADLIELAMNRNLAKSFRKLTRIASPELALLVKEYAKRKDIEDLKTILRGKFTNADRKAVEKSLTAAGTLSYDFLVSLLNKESVEEILKHNKLVNFSLFKEGIRSMNEKKSLVDIENTLDQYYYKDMIKFSNALPKEGALFRDFLLKEVEILNILTLLRLKKAQFKKDSVKIFIISSGNKSRDAWILELASADGLEQLSKTFNRTEYKDVVAKGIEEFNRTNSLIGFEISLYKHLLKRSVLFVHQHPLSVDTILGYMFAKDIEVRNLKMLVKGKQLGLPEQFIENQLIYE